MDAPPPTTALEGGEQHVGKKRRLDETGGDAALSQAEYRNKVKAMLVNTPKENLVEMLADL
jgi:hypothetical protein